MILTVLFWGAALLQLLAVVFILASRPDWALACVFGANVGLWGAVRMLT